VNSVPGFIEIANTPYYFEASQRETLTAMAARVADMRKAGRLTPQVLWNIRKYFRIKNIYHSNAIEGNNLTVGETREVIERGLTITGKSLKDQAEAKNLSEALDFLEELASDSARPISEADIRQIHFLVLKGINDQNAGRYRTADVEISGSEYKPPSPESIPISMRELSHWLANASVPGELFASPDGFMNAVVAHAWFVYIHPFIDGNGRVSRLLMNLLLMRFGYPIAIVTKEDRLRYYDALELSQSSDLSGFIALISECVLESLEEYEAAAKQQLEHEEWAAALAEKLGAPEIVRAKNEYEVWKNAMELLKSYFRQTATFMNDQASAGSVFFRDFGTLEFEKYFSLRNGESAKKTWFFRVDFKSGDRVARYLFFFGQRSHHLRNHADVTLHIAREDPAGSFHYGRLDSMSAPNVPNLLEVGFHVQKAMFAIRDKSRTSTVERFEAIGERFFREVVEKHFA